MTYNKNSWASHDLITAGKLNNIEDGINDVIDRVTYGTGGAEQPTQPIHTPVYLNLGDPLPTDAVSGDYAFVKDGDDFVILEFNGVKWVEQINPNLKERIKDVLAQAETRSQELVDENATAIGTTLDDVQAKQDALTEAQSALDTKAQEYANKALTDAKADTLATATQTAKTASDALATAKTDLTTTLNKEVTDRTKAVSDLDAKAQGYADTAKADAISASTTAIATTNASITKEVADRASAITALDTKAQGYATTAKADAITTANTAITKEVTDRQKAVTDLDTKSTNAINQAKTDAQSALDALQVGTRNLVIKDRLVKGWMGDGVVASGSSAHAMTTDFVAVAPNSSLVAQIWYDNTVDTTNNFLRVAFYDSAKTYLTRTPLAGSGSTTYNKWLITTPANTAFVRMSYDWLADGYGHAKLEIGTKATDYTQAPEDIVLDYTTKDGIISQSLTQYQTTNDGKVTKAQSDATQALGLVATKVSQTSFDTKTGDLDSKYTTVKQTADQASTDIVAIKSTNTSQDTKINTLTSDVSGTKQSISDIQTEQGTQSTKINTIQTDVSGTKQDIIDIQDANGTQDGKIASISTTVDGLNTSFSTYKTTNDGKVAKAQSDITANATAISQKVSQTAYDTKTGQLTTDLNTTTTTANKAKTDIVSINQKDTAQDARMLTIEETADGIKTTVSNLQTEQGEQSGSISTLEQRADGFEATVATLGQVNQLFNTEFSPDLAGWVSGDAPLGKWDVSTSVPLNNDGGYALGDGKHSGSNVLKKSFVSGSRSQFSSLPIPVGAGQAVAGSIQAQSTPTYDGNVTARIDFRYYDSTMNYISMDSVSSGKLLSWTTVQMAKTTPANTAYIVYVLLTNGTIGNNYYSQPMLTFNNKVGQYVQGNYNNNASVSKAQLTADNATLALNNYKSDADGRISKAQADITVNASAITSKVSQTDYNTKTGDLTTKVNTAQSTADSVTTSLNSYKSSNDGKVNKAQADIVVNTNAIATKVAQTTYDTKTNQLQTDLNTTTTTANTAKTDIVAIKSDNTKQDARMLQIESDANGTKTTVSNLQTDLGKTNGSVSTLQQRADGFDATVTKVNNLSVGGRNLMANTKALWMGGIGNNGSKVTLTLEAFDATTNMWHLVAPQQAYTNAGIYLGNGVIKNGDLWALSFDVKGTGNWSSNGARLENSTVTKPVDAITTSWARVSSTGKKVAEGGAVIFYFDLTNSPLDVYIKLPKLETGNLPTDYTPAPEDLEGATAKAQLTADQLSTSLSNYRSDADGRISKAQADIIVNANAITQKVSQSEYNAKTGDLTTKVNTAQSTADGANSTIGAYKTSNDGRVASAESKITQNTNNINLRVTKTDYDANNNTINGKFSAITVTTDKITSSVSDVTTQVNAMGQINQLFNTEFTPDFNGWYVSTNTNPTTDVVTNQFTPKGTDGFGSNVVSHKGGGGWINSAPIPVTAGMALSFSTRLSVPSPVTSGTPLALYIKAFDANNGQLLSTGYNVPTSQLTTTPTTFKLENIVMPAGAVKAFAIYGWNVGDEVYISQPMLVFGSKVGQYTLGQYNNNDKIATQQITIDGISNVVSDPSTGLTKRVQTAEGTLTQVSGADIPALQKATYWQAPTSYDLNSYLTQGSVFFNNTNARTNNPKNDNGWLYLVVEQATPSRITQTAWYDTLVSAKITYKRQYVSGTWSPWYANDNDSVATIAQTNGAIQTEISNRTTGDTNTLTQAKDFTTSSISNSETGMRSQITQTSDAILAKIEAGNLVSNSEFDPDNVGWYHLPTDGSTIDVSGKVTTPVKSYYADWDAVNGSRGIEFGATTGTWITSEPVRASSTGTYSISVLAGRPTATTTAVTMDFRLGLWDKDKKYITSVGGTNPLNGTTYLPLKFYKSENIAVPSNTAFVSFVLGHSGSGTPDAIYHPMINHGATVSPYTPTYGTTASATVLSLLKDNWSIGITDNANAITNGIVGNATNMSLISNNVVINAPSTQIKGTAWINSAMIANGAIGKAQINDASIDTAKIASLDVAKLTGNVSNFIQSNWNGVYSSVAIDGSGMKISTGGTVTTLDQWGTHWSRGNLSSLYGFGYWRDSSGNNTTSTGLYMGVTGSENAFINILGTDGSAAAVLAGSQFDHGSNINIAPGSFNFFTNVNIRTQLAFKGNTYNSPSYIEANEATRTLNFFTGGGSVGGGNYFYFNQNVISAGTFSSTSVLSKKIVESPYTEDALGEISKTQLVNFAYKNRPSQNHVSPIIDDVNDTKEYYIPKTILGQDGEYVDLYTMISMTWKALQQVNDRLEELESR